MVAAAAQGLAPPPVENSAGTGQSAAVPNTVSENLNSARRDLDGQASETHRFRTPSLALDAKGARIVSATTRWAAPRPRRTDRSPAAHRR